MTQITEEEEARLRARIRKGGDAKPRSRMQRSLSAEQILVARTLDALTSVSERNLREAPDGQAIGIPAWWLRELAAAIETVYPGMIADVRERQRIGPRGGKKPK